MRITRTDRTTSFRVNVDARLLEEFQSALQTARHAGLQVDYRLDVESLLARLTRKLRDALAEGSALPGSRAALAPESADRGDA